MADVQHPFGGGDSQRLSEDSGPGVESWPGLSAPGRVPYCPGIGPVRVSRWVSYRDWG